MTSLVRRFLKTAILFLAVGLGIGGWMMVRRELWGELASSYVVSAHTHAVFVGFVMLMILGVALWMFPRPQAGDGRYQPALVETAYWLLTVGTAGRILGELLRSSHDSVALRGAVLATGLAQIAGVAVFFFTMWTRIRPVGSAAREARGERF